MIPSGRLTLVSGRPVMGADVIGATHLFYTPYTDPAMTELSLSLAGLPAGAIYDVSSDGAALSLSPWSGNTPPARTAAWVGTIQIDPTPGQISAHFSYGQNRRFGVWNAYNRKRIILKAGDPRPAGVNGYKYLPYWGPNNFGASNNDPGNSLTVLIGAAEEPVRAIYRQSFFLNEPIGGAGTKYANAVGWGSVNGPVSTPPGFMGANNTIDVGTLAASYTGAAEYIAPPFVGAVPVTAFECGRTGGVTAFWGEGNMLLTAEYWG